MPCELLADWQAEQLPLVEHALEKAIQGLPASCRVIAGHVLKAGGKRLRPLLTLAFSRLFSPCAADIYPLACSMELLHAATLLHDDVLDHAERRRGQPAAHTVYGITRTILAGDALLAHGNRIVAAYGNPDLVTCYSDATAGTAAGEILEMDALRNPELSHEQYLEIARGKTACLIAQSCLMGAIAAGASMEQRQLCLKFGDNLGVAFQIIDDALDFLPETQTGKPTGGDLREGKVTPPLRIYRDSLPARERIQFDMNFAGNTFPPQELTRIADAIAEFIPEASGLADSCLAEAMGALNQLPRHSEHEILAQMVEYVRSRRK